LCRQEGKRGYRVNWHTYEPPTTWHCQGRDSCLHRVCVCVCVQPRNGVRVPIRALWGVGKGRGVTPYPESHFLLQRYTWTSARASDCNKHIYRRTRSNELWDCLPNKICMRCISGQKTGCLKRLSITSKNNVCILTAHDAVKCCLARQLF